MDEHATGQINALQLILDNYVKVRDKGALVQLRLHRIKLLDRTPSDGFLLIALRTQLLAELTLIEAALHKVDPVMAEPPQPEQDSVADTPRVDVIAAAIIGASLGSRAEYKNATKYAEQIYRRMIKPPPARNPPS